MVVAMTATEVSSQLATQKVDIRLVDGDPELIVVDDDAEVPSSPPPPDGDFDEARITIRFPGYLKDLVADAASTSGDSVKLSSSTPSSLRLRSRRAVQPDTAPPSNCDRAGIQRR